MPYKHQANSYRNKNGIKYICWGDFYVDSAGTKKQIIKEVKKFKRKGKKAFAEKHNDGYYRIFVEDCEKT